MIAEQIRNLNLSIAKLEKTIGEEGSKRAGHQSLSSIKGIGKITGAILLSVIGDVNDFPDEGRLASYLAIVPRVSNSSGSSKISRTLCWRRDTKRVTAPLISNAWCEGFWGAGKS